MAVAASGVMTTLGRAGRNLPQRGGARFLDLGMRRQVLEGQHVVGGQADDGSGADAPVRSASERTTGSNSSTARLSQTITTSGREVSRAAAARRRALCRSE